MARLLFLVHRIPFPPNKGDKIRSFNILKALAAEHDVSVGAFVDDPDDVRYQADLAPYCSALYLQEINPSLRKGLSLHGLATGQALSIAFYRSARFQSWVNDQLAGGIDAVILFSSAMAQFISPAQARQVPVWMDFVDLDSDKWTQYAAKASGVMGWLYRREARTLLRFETSVARQVRTSSFVTHDEVALFGRLTGLERVDVRAVQNGVDLDFFTPTYTPSNDCVGADLVFTGAMDYQANVDAVCGFAKRIWPRLQQARPGITLKIVGSKPAPAVLALGKDPHIEVTGFVDDVRDHVATAALAIAPMEIARGVQNKVLEAMAMGKAVVTTPQGFEGIEAEPGKDLSVAASDDAQVEAILGLLTDRAAAQALGRRARAAMERNYRWDAALAPLLDFARTAGNGMV